MSHGGTAQCPVAVIVARHALNNQLLWAGVVTGRETVSIEETMTGIAVEGDLAAIATDVAERAVVMCYVPVWSPSRVR